MAESQATGKRGEDIAAAELRSRGWRVVARNLRTRAGEADVVAVRPCPGGRRAIVVEVKTTRGDRELTARVDERKAARLWAIAHQICSGSVEALADVRGIVEIEVAVAEIRLGARATQVRWRTLELW